MNEQKQAVPQAPTAEEVMELARSALLSAHGNLRGVAPLTAERCAKAVIAIDSLTQAAPQAEWQMPAARDVLAFIKRTPLVASLLYDLNLLPEQIDNARDWGYMVTVCNHMDAAR